MKHTNPQEQESKSADGTIFEFLQGSHSYEGVWFGEKHPTRKGHFWWRSILTEQFSQQTATVSKNSGQLRTEFENNPPFEFAAEDYYKVYSEWLEGKVAAQGRMEVLSDDIKKQIYLHLDSLKYEGGYPDGWEETLSVLLLSWLQTQAPALPDFQKYFNELKDIRMLLLLHPDGKMIEDCCLHLLGDEAQEWWKNKGAVALPVPDAAKEAVGFERGDLMEFAKLILSQYKAGNTNIEQSNLMEETLNIFINEK